MEVRQRVVGCYFFQNFPQIEYPKNSFIALGLVNQKFLHRNLEEAPVKETLLF